VICVPSVFVAEDAYAGGVLSYVKDFVVADERFPALSVDVTEIDEFEQFPAISAGDIDATMEVWPSGHAQDYADYIDASNGVVDGGQLGREALG